MAGAKLVSSPSASGDEGVASTVLPSATEGATATVATACGESASIEETPEARVLAQGPYSCPITALYYHLPRPITMIVEFYFADTNLPYDKSVDSVPVHARIRRRLITLFNQIHVVTSHR